MSGTRKGIDEDKNGSELQSIRSPLPLLPSFPPSLLTLNALASSTSSSIFPSKWQYVRRVTTRETKAGTAKARQRREKRRSRTTRRQKGRGGYCLLRKRRRREGWTKEGKESQHRQHRVEDISFAQPQSAWSLSMTPSYPSPSPPFLPTLLLILTV